MKFPLNTALTAICQYWYAVFSFVSRHFLISPVISFLAYLLLKVVLIPAYLSVFQFFIDHWLQAYFIVVGEVTWYNFSLPRFIKTYFVVWCDLFWKIFSKHLRRICGLIPQGQISSVSWIHWCLVLWSHPSPDWPLVIELSILKSKVCSLWLCCSPFFPFSFRLIFSGALLFCPYMFH